MSLIETESALDPECQELPVRLYRIWILNLHGLHALKSREPSSFDLYPCYLQWPNTTQYGTRQLDINFTQSVPADVSTPIRLPDRPRLGATCTMYNIFGGFEGTFHVVALKSPFSTIP